MERPATGQQSSRNPQETEQSTLPPHRKETDTHQNKLKAGRSTRQKARKEAREKVSEIELLKQA